MFWFGVLCGATGIVVVVVVVVYVALASAWSRT